MNLEQQLNEITGRVYGKNIAACTNAQLYSCVLQLTQNLMEQKPVLTGEKKVYYISMEFLIGKLLSNNLINLGGERQAAFRHRGSGTGTFSRKWRTGEACGMFSGFHCNIRASGRRHRSQLSFWIVQTSLSGPSSEGGKK